VAACNGNRNKAKAKWEACKRWREENHIGGWTPTECCHDTDIIPDRPHVQASYPLV
jgi:hypothetical protein